MAGGDWLTAAASAFAVIVPVELPDKTFVATLVLSTRYPSLPVWAGATAAFAVQCAVAAAAGGVIALLPATPVRAAAALLFAIGAVLLICAARERSTEHIRAARERSTEHIRAARERSTEHSRAAREADVEEAEQEQRFLSQAPEARTGWRAFGASFLLLFLAEWGDLSQLLTAGLVASGRPAVPVFLGSWLGLALVAGVGVLLGRVILRHVRLRYVRYVGAGVCLSLSIGVLYALILDLYT